MKLLIASAAQTVFDVIQCSQAAAVTRDRRNYVISLCEVKAKQCVRCGT